MRLLHSRLFPTSSALPLLLIASTDSETKVKERAEALVRLQTDSRAQAPSTPDKAIEDKNLANNIIRLFLGGQDSVVPGSNRTKRSALSESARVKLLDWAIKECPESLASHEGLCLKVGQTCVLGNFPRIIRIFTRTYIHLQAALQTLTSPDEGMIIRGLGARLAAFLAVRCPPGPFALAGPLLLAAIKKVLAGCYQALLMARQSGAANQIGSALDREAIVREGCYETLAGLAHRMGGTVPGGPPPTQAHLLFSDPLLLRLLFEALASESPVQVRKHMASPTFFTIFVH